MKISPNMSAYKLKVSLKGIRPAISRTIAVPKNITFADLHNIIQTAMGWKDEHLHEFVIKDDGTRIVPSDTDIGPLGMKYSFEEVTPLIKYQGKKIEYIYDSMSNWVHTIRFLKDVVDYRETYPKVIKYQNKCPPEESGGARGFLEKLEIMEDYTHPDYDYVIDWFNEEYAEYYVDDVNESLKNLKRVVSPNTLSADEVEEIMMALITDTAADFYYDVQDKKVCRDHKNTFKDEPERYLMIRTSKANILDRIMRNFAMTRNTDKDARVLGAAMSSRVKRLARFEEAAKKLGYGKEWTYVMKSSCFTIAADWANRNGFVAPKDPSIELLAKWMMAE